MIILEDTSDAQYQIRAYEPGKITVNHETYSRSLIIAANQLIPDWEPQSFGQLTLEHLKKILDLNPEIVLLGTGIEFKPLPEKFSQFFFQHHIGIETMNTHSACKTYMALVSEGRKVVAGLLIE